MRRRHVLAASILVALIALAPRAWAQAQAINGNIEGVVKDASGGVLPGVTVTVANIGTGLVRSLVTDDTGTYRAALLPLGIYRVKAELQGFKIIERSGISLSAGQTAVVNLELQVGGVEERIEVTANSPVTEPAKIDLGRTISETEIQNLPNIARNYFNFALFQPNVTGYKNEEFGATRVNANGTQMRVNYQIDGASATQKNRAGLRMFQPSEVMVEEVKVITSGFAPEFGHTTGMVYNSVTPSGTNQFKGQGSYRFRRKAFSARPFTLAAGRPKPDTKIDNLTGAIGGPIARDRAFFYAGYERHRNDLSAGRVITVSPAAIAALGLSPSAIGDGVIPAVQTVEMFIAKGDVQLSPANRLSARWSVFKNSTPENIGGGLNTREIATDFKDRMDSVGAQLVSTIGASQLNEVRIAYGRRDNPREPSAVAGSGPQISITGVANFGGPPTPTEFVEEYWQIIDNYSWSVGRHNFKAGFDVQVIDDFRVNAVTPTYIFPSLEAFLAARTGSNPFGYTRFEQAVGDPSVDYSQRYYSFFVQDDVRLTPQIKLLYGVRYDLFDPPDADPSAPHPSSRSFRTDQNNWGPRVGVAWSMDAEAKTVVRASTGVMYDAPLGIFYEDALLDNGNPKLLTARLTPTQTGAPAFPNTLSSLPPGVTPSRSIRTVSPDFDAYYSVLTNVQVERGLTDDLSVALGYVNSTGRNLPTLLNSNVKAIGATLPDGRPIFARTPLNDQTRVDPRFDTINEIRSTGRSKYNALTVSVARRLGGGYQFQAFYTLAQAKEDGVLGGRYVIGSTDTAGLSDPSNQKRDYSFTSWNVTHTFVASAVLSPRVSRDGPWSTLLNDNQLALVVQANSGLPFNIRSNRDLNLDGISADRPNGIARNSGNLGRYLNVDARYSRFVPFTDRMQLEIFAEAENLFNTKSIRAVNSVVQTDTLGNPLAVSGAFPLTQTYDARQFQLGFRVRF